MNTEITSLLSEQTTAMLAMAEEIKGLRDELKSLKKTKRSAPTVTDQTPVAVCQAKTKTDKPCTFKAKENSCYCGRHKNYNSSTSTVIVAEVKTCEALTKTKKPCAAKAKEGSCYCGRHKNYDLSKVSTVTPISTPVEETPAITIAEPVPVHNIENIVDLLTYHAIDDAVTELKEANSKTEISSDDY